MVQIGWNNEPVVYDRVSGLPRRKSIGAWRRVATNTLAYMSVYWRLVHARV